MKTTKLPNTCGKTQATKLSLVSVLHLIDWLRKWREFFEPITLRKTGQSNITFEIQCKILIEFYGRFVLFEYGVDFPY